jgi:ParB/RepB/Spo0J family partition protein
MLPDDELDELTADIRANGLLMPLLVGRVNGQRVLVDGRNRREACRRAGIVPNYTLLSDGEDLSARILSENVYRRHLTKGQRAIVVATLLETSKVPQQMASRQAGLSQQRLSQARTVLRHARDLADSVRNGSISLDNAYEEARVRKGRADTHESRFESLKAVAPDLVVARVLETNHVSQREAADSLRIKQPTLAKVWSETDHWPKC